MCSASNRADAHEPKVIKVAATCVDTTSGDTVSKTNDDFYSKISSINDNTSTHGMELNLSNLP